MSDISTKYKWYILKVPQEHRGNSLKQLEVVKKRSDSSVLFEYFAPLYEKMVLKGGKMVASKQQLYLNYVFIKSELNFLKKLKREELSLYSFLPRIKDAEKECYPFVTEKQMSFLKWIAESYSNTIPIYIPQSEKVMKGDKVRITKGDFKGMEAIVSIQPGRGQRNIVVSLGAWVCVPLINVKEGEYEIIEYNCENKHLYTRMNNDVLSNKLHQALQRYHAGLLTEEDGELAKKCLSEYGNSGMREQLKRESKHVLSSKLYALILPAYTILGEVDALQELIGEISAILEKQLQKAPQARALLYVTLYGCTNNFFYYQQAHQLVGPWRKESNPKKAIHQLINRLDDYDRWFDHIKD